METRGGTLCKRSRCLREPAWGARWGPEGVPWRRDTETPGRSRTCLDWWGKDVSRGGNSGPFPLPQLLAISSFCSFRPKALQSL